MADVKHTRRRIFIDAFSGKVADLPKGYRTSEDILKALDKSPRVSTWDMGELVWLRSAISDLKKLGLIVSDPNEPYPWHRYTLTDAGRAAIAKATGGAARATEGSV